MDDVGEIIERILREWSVVVPRGVPDPTSPHDLAVLEHMLVTKGGLPDAAARRMVVGMFRDARRRAAGR